MTEIISELQDEIPLEILVSTMNRVDLEFLNAMFKDVNLDDVFVLVINQIEVDSKRLTSNKKNVRVINSFEKGLTNSRNLAIENARGRLCLIADDDVTYLEGFKAIIINAFNKYDEADIITFQMINDKGKLFRLYKDQVVHDKKTIELANSVVIAFKNMSISSFNVRFDPLFGLGCAFQTANEYVFLKNCMSENLKLYFEPKTILSHPEFSSGQAVSSDKIIFAKGALFYKYFGLIGYLKLIHHLLLLLKARKMGLTQVWHKFSIGLQGMRKYKALQKG